MIDAGFIARLKVAVIDLPPPATPFVLVVTNWLPSVGSELVTLGIVGPADAAHTAPGEIAPGGTKMIEAGRTLEPPLPHPATNAVSSEAINHISNLEWLLNMFICFPFLAIAA